MTSRLRPSPPRVATLIAIAIVAHTVLQSWSMIAEGRLLQQFGWAFGHDQLGYMAISANVGSGVLAPVEPDTETGINHYPALWYSVVGAVSALPGWTPVLAWNVLALVVQAVMIGALGYAAARLSGRAWTALLAPLPFVVGTFAWILVPAWFMPLRSHAVLWGPFAVFYPHNAETAGLCLGVAAMACLAAVWFRPSSSRARWTVSIVAAVVIGGLANMQTYSFLTCTYVVCGILAAGEIFRRRSWVAGAVSVALTILLFAAGPALTSGVGQLGALVSGLIPALPGLVLLAVRTRGRFLAIGLVAVAAAAPQVLFTVVGLAQHDPFLTYRVGSNSDLGVGFRRTLLASAIPVVGLLALLVFGWARRSTRLVGLGAGVLGAGSLLAVNDVWGANAEPYRLWIDSLFVALPLLGLGLASLAGTVPRGALRKRSTRRRALPVIVVAAALALASAATLPDFVRYTTDAGTNTYWNPNTSRQRAIEDSARRAESSDDRIIVLDPCIDPRTTKIVSDARIAFYHLGMAWPARVDDVSEVMAGRDAGRLDLDAARRAGAGWVITDSTCTAGWPTRYASALTEEGSSPFVRTADDDAVTGSGDAPRRGTITVWRLDRT